MFYYYPYLIWEHIFQLGWFNHQLEMSPYLPKTYPIPNPIPPFFGGWTETSKQDLRLPKNKKTPCRHPSKRLIPSNWIVWPLGPAGDSASRQVAGIPWGKNGKGAYGGFLMVVPPNHPNLIGFSIINHPFWGTPIFLPISPSGFPKPSVQGLSIQRIHSFFEKSE